MLPGTVQKSAARLGFDTVWRLTSLAPVFYHSGFRFCVRYISRADFVSEETEGAGSLSAAEAKAILGAGLALMPVQYAKLGYQPSAAGGAQLGANAAKNATKLGIPEGCTVWCDAEAFAADASTNDAVAFVNAWHEAVDAGGYRPGIYVGPNSKLTTAVLYSELKFQSYWKSASYVGNVNTRGYQMMQSLHQKIHGITVDFDVTAIDSKKGRPYWLQPDPPEDDQEASLVEYDALRLTQP